MSSDYDRERAIHRLTTGRDLPYGRWKSRSMADAQVAQRRMWGDLDENGRLK